MGHDDQSASERTAQHSVMTTLRASPAHGVTGSEEVRTQWDELGCLLSTGSHLSGMAADPVKRRISKALAASADVDRDDIDGLTERVYRRISAWAIEDWEDRSFDDGDDDEEPDGLNIEVLHVRPAEPTSREEDKAFLQGMLDGTVHLLDPLLAHRLIPLVEKHATDADMTALIERAAQAYGDAAVAAARKALADTGHTSPPG